ncbi:MAG: hypothetical protein ABSG68_13235 [Thermoguttaceae bacterium]
MLDELSEGNGHGVPRNKLDAPHYSVVRCKKLAVIFQLKRMKNPT